MSPPPAPSDDELRLFLLGTLPADRAEAVRRWLNADPSHASQLDRFSSFNSNTLGPASRPAGEPPPRPGSGPADPSGSGTLPRTPHSGIPPTDPHGGTVPRSGPPMLHASLPWPPTRLGQFRILRELGHGGMGYVFEAEDEKLGRRVAVKVLSPELSRRPDAAARFLREARAAAAVEHENVVPILHVGEEGGLPYIVMPLLRGESLAQRLRRGALPVEEVVRVGRDVAAGLTAAHGRGLVHRDLKPANVWLDAETGRARVLDFGLARHGDGRDAMTEPGAIQGTPAYMAPEQIDGAPATPLFDLFALGATLYECAAGRRAFEGSTVTAVLKAVATHQPPAPAEVNLAVPPALSALIMRLLAKDPAERPATACEVFTALSGLSLMGDVSHTTTVLHSAAGQGPSRFRKRALRVGGAGVLVTLIAAGIWLGTRPTHPAATPDLAGNPNTAATEPARPARSQPPAPVHYRGQVDVRIARAVEGRERLLRLNEPGALPMKMDDKFRIEAEVDPPAYLYAVWVDPGHDVTPVYPWDPEKGWGSRPGKEEPRGKLSLPPEVKNRYTAPDARPGVATIVLFARSEPLAVPDAEVERWFASLPEVAPPQGDDTAAIWFEDFTEVVVPGRLRTFGKAESADPFARWQAQLQKSLAEYASFQAAVSFARTGRK